MEERLDNNNKTYLFQSTAGSSDIHSLPKASRSTLVDHTPPLVDLSGHHVLGLVHTSLPGLTAKFAIMS